MIDLPIIIVSWNVRELLARCLASIQVELERSRIAGRVRGRVIVVDNASHDGSPDMVRERFPQVELVASDENLGFAKGNNVGLRLAPDCEFALLLNPDTEVQPGAIATLLAGMRARPDVAVATSRLFYGEGAFQHSAFHFPGLSQLYIDLFPVSGRFYESRLNGRYPRRLYDSGAPFEIDTPLGAVMLLRGDAMRQVGLFDESFALYCEEIDWAARFKEAGWRNICVPSAQITHHEGRSTSQVKVASFVKLWTARQQLHGKHPQFAPLPLARLIVTQGMKRKMREADAEMRAACEKVIEVWTQ